WIVGSGELMDKPIALVNATTRATHAWASLLETLTVMSARVIDDASVTIPLDGRKLDADGIVGNEELSRLVRASLSALTREAQKSVSPKPQGEGGPVSPKPQGEGGLNPTYGLEWPRRPRQTRGR